MNNFKKISSQEIGFNKKLPVNKNLNTTGKYKNSGRWIKSEHKQFIEGILKNGNNWKKTVEKLGTRTTAQARSHSQKFFIKLHNLGIFNYNYNDNDERFSHVKIFNEFSLTLNKEEYDNFLNFLCNFPYSKERLPAIMCMYNIYNILDKFNYFALSYHLNLKNSNFIQNDLNLLFSLQDLKKIPIFYNNPKLEGNLYQNILNKNSFFNKIIKNINDKKESRDEGRLNIEISSHLNEDKKDKSIKEENYTILGENFSSLNDRTKKSQIFEKNFDKLIYNDHDFSNSENDDKYTYFKENTQY